jgi:hypothetical protein
MLTSKALNEAIRKVEARADYYGGPMAKGDKAFPYIGWFWRDVDFDKRIVLGYCNASDDIGGVNRMEPFVGFMETNKWGYDEWYATEDQSARIRELAENAALDPCPARLQAVYDYMQTCRDAGVPGAVVE